MQSKIKYCLWFLMLLWAGCTEKEIPVLDPPTLTTNTAADVTRFSATLSGTIRLSGSSTVKEYGLAYSTVSSMPEENTERVRISYNSSQNTYEVMLTDLKPGTSYYYRFYATNGYTEVYSEKLSFTTKTDDVPMLDAVTLLSSAENSIEVKSSLIDDGGSTIQQYGFAYNKVGSSTGEKQVQASNKGEDGVFSLVINDLEHSSEYEVRAYAVNSKGTGYSEVLPVSTVVPVTPEVKLTAIASNHRIVTLLANIPNADLANGITEVGFYWGTESESDDLEQKGQHIIAMLEDDNTFKADLIDLEQNTTYYIKAYAINKGITGYSEVVNATTTRSVVPVLGALTATSTTENSATLKGSITDFGGHDIKSLGYAIKSEGKEETSGEIDMSNLQADGTFTFTVTGLQHSTAYEIRAFATNEAGQGYSETLSVTTATPKTPSLSLVAAADNYQSVSVTATVQNPDEANGITEVGFYYGKSKENLETQGKQVVTTLNNNVFKTTLTGLEQNTTYYIKAYAINKGIKGYSEVANATTARSVVPVLGALTATSTTENSATLKGSITDFGGHDIKSLGYAIKSEGKEETSGEINMSSLQEDGTFTFTVTDLQHSTAYEIRAFATNEAGQGYSETLSVTTATPKTPSLSLVAVADNHQSVSVTATVLNPTEANGITEVGFYYGKSKENLETQGKQVVTTLNNNVFKTTFTGLEQNTTYYIKAYAINKGIKGYSEVVNATTSHSSVPVLGALTLVTASEKALVVAGIITDKGGHDITGLGYLYQKPNSAEEIRSELTLDKLNPDGTFQFTVADLQPGYTYQIRAFAINQAGTGYSSYASLATKAQEEPTLNIAVGDVTINSIQLTASVTDKGSTGATLLETGFVYSTSTSQPTLVDQKVVMDNVDENFSTVLNNLQSGTTYYIRAYAKNDTKLGYSEVKTVTTTRSTKPSVDKVTISNITESGATLTGKVLDTGNNNLTGIGFSYKTADGSEMQVSVNLTDLGNDNTFQTILSGLNANTDYQVRAYATNKEGTGYSSEYTTFKTVDFVAPKLTFSSSDVTAESMVLSAVIQSIGKEESTLGEVGFCWSTTNKTPTVSDEVKKVTANGMNFGATLDKLKPETTYYIRAFATNESTIGYSNVITVKTLASDKPSLDDNPTPDIK